MGKRKVFEKTDLSVPQVEYCRDGEGVVAISSEAIPPAVTLIEFERNASNRRYFEFVPWYGVGIDPITYACQRQIERFLAKQDTNSEVSTITAYCRNGLSKFLDYCVLRATALGRGLTLTDVNRDLIDGYLAHLAGMGIETTGQKSIYTHTKPVLLALGRRKLFNLITKGDAATFPSNPFPNISSKRKGETALNKREREAFTLALRQALKPLWAEDVVVTSELLSYVLLTVALYTGRNTTPLLEMSRDCLRAHPKDNTFFLILWKRRGYKTSKVALRSDSDDKRGLESTPTVRTNVERLIRGVLALTEPLRIEAPDDLKSRVWLYRIQVGTRYGDRIGDVTALHDSALRYAIKNLVTDYGLTDSDGKPLRINISRLRKTFANRIWELLGGDLASTAIALGNTPRVADNNYLAPNEEARSKWRFMGEVLVRELLTETIGVTYKETPTGRCSDLENGQYAPKREGATCFNFTNCLRCKNYAVTADDLYKLFSFYFRVLAERSRMDKRRWEREYAQIPRLIDKYIVAEGVRRGTFKLADVEAARELARIQPHPFWSFDLIERLEVFS